jgi:hypothetical protein
MEVDGLTTTAGASGYFYISQPLSTGSPKPTINGESSYLTASPNYESGVIGGQYFAGTGMNSFQIFCGSGGGGATPVNCTSGHFVLYGISESSSGGGGGGSGSFYCDTFTDLAACISAANAYVGTNESGLGNAALVILGSKTYSTGGTPIALASGITIRGVPPRPSASSNLLEGSFTPNGGTIIDCGGGTGCFTAQATATTTLRDINLEGMGFKNWTGNAIQFGGPNVGGVMLGSFRQLNFFGNATCCTSDKAIFIYNSQSIGMQQIYAAQINQGLVWRTDDTTAAINDGNAKLSDIWFFGYPHTTANGNQNEPLISLQASGSGITTNYIDIDKVHTSIAAGGDNTANIIEIVSSSGGQAINNSITNIDAEGNCLAVVNLVGASENVFSFHELPGGSCTGVTADGNSGWNTFQTFVQGGTTSNAGGTGNLYYGPWNPVPTNLNNQIAIVGNTNPSGSIVSTRGGTYVTFRAGTNGTTTPLPSTSGNTGNTTNNSITGWNGIPQGQLWNSSNNTGGIFNAQFVVSGCTGNAAPYSGCTAANTGTCTLMIRNDYQLDTSTSGGSLVATVTAAAASNATLDLQIDAPNSGNPFFVAKTSGGTVTMGNLLYGSYAANEFFNAFLQNSVGGDRCFITRAEGILTP